MRKNDRRCVRNLIVIELTEVTDLHLAFSCIRNGSKAIKLRIGSLELLNCLYNVGKLSYTRGLYYDPVGLVLYENLLKSLSEITDERATDATRIHLCNFNSGILKKSSVNTDLTELVLYKNYLFVVIRFLYKLFYKSGLTCSKKAGKYIYLCDISEKMTNL